MQNNGKKGYSIGSKQFATDKTELPVSFLMKQLMGNDAEGTTLASVRGGRPHKYGPDATVLIEDGMQFVVQREEPSKLPEGQQICVCCGELVNEES